MAHWLLGADSATYATAKIEDYNLARKEQTAFWIDKNGKQVGDPDKLAQALLSISDSKPVPARFIAGRCDCNC